MSFSNFARSGALAAILLATPFAAPAFAQSAPAPLIAQGCAGCHGQAGEGIVGASPPIAGYGRDAMIASFSAFAANERPGTIMNRIARGYTDAEIAALADYFSSLR
ncbi:MAG: cytochrome C [Salinarimonadaceae bacterium]|nr:MAG: cytochrome C [Salinarimonadaceae bacterium]